MLCHQPSMGPEMTSWLIHLLTYRIQSAASLIVGHFSSREGQYYLEIWCFFLSCVIVKLISSGFGRLAGQKKDIWRRQHMLYKWWQVLLLPDLDKTRKLYLVAVAEVGCWKYNHCEWFFDSLFTAWRSRNGKIKMANIMTRKKKTQKNTKKEIW